MTETYMDSGAMVTWSTPQCPFAIDYSRKTLDDIRLAAVDAFFSLPRGGAEIGGVLLGRLESQRLHILDYAPLECEHAFGPGFTLSPMDQAKLLDLLTELQERSSDLRPVGWYHSHTRSGISFCEADLEIHNRYFPQRWQVALVLQPSTLQPTRAGFFFREPDGSMHTENSYCEFVLEALPLRQMPSGVPEAVPGPIRESEPGAVVITLPASEAPQEHREEAPEMRPAEPSAEHVVVSEATIPQQPSAEPMASEWMFSKPAAAEPAPPMTEFSTETLPAPTSDSLAPLPAETPAEAVYQEAVRQEAVHQEAVHQEAVYQPEEAEAEPYHEIASRPAAEPVFEAAPEYESPSPYRPEAEHEARPAAEPIPPAADAQTAEPAPRRRWLGIAAGVVVGLGLGAAADQVRSHLLTNAATAAPAPSRSTAAARQVPAPEDPALRRQNEELTKQNADLVQQVAALHKQNDDLTKQQSGLSAQQSDLGKQEADLRQQRDELAKLNAKLKADLGAQTARSQSLQQQLEDLRRQQQRRRLSVQSTDLP